MAPTVSNPAVFDRLDAAASGTNAQQPFVDLDQFGRYESFFSEEVVEDFASSLDYVSVDRASFDAVTSERDLNHYLMDWEATPSTPQSTKRPKVNPRTLSLL
jgi:hypothetical protein